jgi:CheY-like chemotaxis protein
MINQTTHACRVLVVDDDEDILEEFRQAFTEQVSSDEAAALSDLEAELFGAPAAQEQRLQFELVTCTQGEQAVAAVTRACAENRPFAIAFLDVRMPPGIDGVRAAKQIRRIDPRLPIVFVTAYADTRPEQLQHQVPPSDKVQYFRKPFQVTDFVRLATEICTH